MYATIRLYYYIQNIEIYFNQKFATPISQMSKIYIRGSSTNYIYVDYIGHGSGGVVNKVQFKGRKDFEAMKMIEYGDDLK